MTTSSNPDAPFVASTVEMIAPCDLVERANNSKNHPPDQIARLAGAIREFGFVIPILIDAENVIIAGHGRKMAGEAIGMSLLPCVRAVGISDAQARALALFDNKIAETGFDVELLKREFSELLDLDAELAAMTGFSDRELAKLLADVGEGEKVETPKPPSLRFGEHKIEMTKTEERALNSLAECWLKRQGDFKGFVKALIKGEAGK